MNAGRDATSRLHAHAAALDVSGGRVASTWAALGGVVNGQVQHRGAATYMEPLAVSIRRCGRDVGAVQAAIAAQLRRLDEP